MALHTLAEVLAATGGVAHDVTEEGFNSVSIDSRDIAPGALFVAIRGDRFDGHDFAAAAIAAGAGAALVSSDRSGEMAGLPRIAVPDPLQGLRDIARSARARSKAGIVAITGSAGKTTTKEAVRAVLSTAGETHASVKSFNNHWGVPLTLARLPVSARFGVFEIGMNHAGEITPLSELVRPHVAVITSIGPAHIGNLGSMAAIAMAKAEIFSGLEPGGTAIVNADHDYLDILLSAARRAGSNIVTFGYAQRADVRITNAEETEAGTLVRAVFEGRAVDMTLSARGRHMASNAVAALCVARCLGIDLAVAARAAEGLSAGEGRGAAVQLDGSNGPVELIDESYNANPASMRAALEVFGNTRAPGGRRVLVLGAMRELGEFARRFHAELEKPVLAARPDAVFLVGDDMAALAAALAGQVEMHHFETVDEASSEVLNGLAQGDLVMVKGSLSVGLGGLVKSIRARFSA
ncbi:MAG TPA: UDP-N-acetylmuramoyl-tripeptide--D-alanyl-D-alanine ligase [Devosiaceae bacterium]